MVGMIFVRKIIHLATKIFGSTNFNHIPAEFVISYKSIVDTLVVLLFAPLLELTGSRTSSFLPNANINGSFLRHSFSEELEATVCQHVLGPSSRERHRLAHFVLNRVLGLGLGFSLSQILPIRTSLLRSFGSAFGVGSVCPSGPRIPTAHFVGRSWINWEISL